MSAEHDHSHDKKKVNLQYVIHLDNSADGSANASYSDASGAEKKEVRTTSNKLPRDDLDTDPPMQELDTATAILKKKKKPNSLM